MIKKISLVIFKLIFSFLKLFDIITKKRLSYIFLDTIQNNSYETININNIKTKFFIPSSYCKYRLNTLFSKEPDTINWINSFEKKKNLIFWDVGANIGLYSIYAAQKLENVKIVAFEPSHSNLRSLSRNISINNLVDKIEIIPLPLSEAPNEISTMKESMFMEGGSFNSFKQDYMHNTKKHDWENSYKVLSSSIDFFIDNKILSIPDYIKIDVDGIEHLILGGGRNCLKNEKIKSILIEVCTDFKEQYDQVFKIMDDTGFKTDKRTSEYTTSNFIFYR